MADEGRPEPAPNASGPGFRGQTIQDGILTVGACACDLSPSYDGHGGGFDADLIREIAGRMGLTPEFRNTTNFDVMSVLALVGDEYDVFLSVTISDARAQLVNFSAPYYRDHYALVVNTALRPDIGGFDDLGEGDVVDAGLPDFASYLWADARLSASGVSFGFSWTDGLESGSLTAILGQEAEAALLVADHPTFEIVEVVDAGSSSGFPVGPGNTELLEAVNDALRAVIDDGTYQEIYDRWFDSPAGSVAR